jgi:hypothetical protein
MSNDQGKGGTPPATDDRTILDPLNADELRALREARERFQKQAAPASHAVGPDQGDDIGDAPTRAMPAIPSFDKTPGVSLNNLSTPKIIADAKPMAPGSARIPSQQIPPANYAPPAPQPHGQQGQPPQAGQPGFGENTLMWMAPVKAPAEAEPQIIPERGQAAAAGMTPTAIPQDTKGRRAMTYAIGAVALVVVALAGFFIFSGGGRPGVVELVTVPPKAMVTIDGKSTEVMTPMKASLQPGRHNIEIELDGFRKESFTVDVTDGQQPTRRNIDLHPISKPGLTTVTIEVSPVAANITIDGTTYAAKKTLKIANVDPNAAHKIVVEAGGYAKFENEIPAGQLKESYNFILQAQKPEGTN